MKHVTWHVIYRTPPAALRHCKKCGSNTPHESSGRFRVNAQKRSLDIWLIYKCSICDATWNREILSRVNPRSIAPGKLRRFETNDADLAMEYAMDACALRRMGIDVRAGTYCVEGEEFSPEEDVELFIECAYDAPIRAAAIVREKLLLSQRQFERLIEAGRLRGGKGENPRKCQLHKGVTFQFCAVNEQAQKRGASEGAL